MRKIKLGKKTMKKAMMLMMAVVLTVSAAMSNMTVMTVYAQEAAGENDAISGITSEEEQVADLSQENGLQAEAETVTTSTTEKETTELEDGTVITEETITETTTITGENIDISEEITVTENPEIKDGGTEYYVDEIQVENAEQVTGCQDYVVKEQVLDESATQVNHYIVDAEGNYVLDENEEKIAVEDGTKIEKIEVVKKKDVSEETNEPASKEAEETTQTEEMTEAVPQATPEVILEKVDEEDVVFVKENEAGVKELVEADTDGAEEYVEVEDGSEYVDAVTINELTTTDAQGNEIKQFIDDDLAKLLDDDDTTTSENYSLETVYTVTVKDEDGNEQKVEIKNSELQEGDNLEVNEEDGSIKVSVDEKKSYTFVGKDNKTYSADNAAKAVKEKGKYYITSSEGVKVEVKNKHVETTESISYQTTLGGESYTVDPKNIKTEIHYEVYMADENGEEELVMELTKEQYESIEIASKDYAKVEDAYVVYDAEGKEAATFTEEEWKVITEAEVTYKEVTKLYYTTEAEYIETTFGNKGNELKSGENYYKLDVKLFKNTDGIVYGAPACVIDEATSEAVISIPYTLKDGSSGTFERRIALADFGLSNYATVEIKYVPSYTTKEAYEFAVDVIRNTEETTVTVKTETTTKTTTTVQTNLTVGTTEENPVKANNGEAINEAGTNNYKAEHIDVRINVNLSDKLKEMGVKNAKVVNANVIIDRNEKYVASSIRQESYGVYEYNFSKGKVNVKKPDQHNGNNGEGNSGFQSNQLVTILAQISYELDGEEKTLWYAVNLYPDEESELNVCKGVGKSLGFDYVISLEDINAAIEEQITSYNTVTNMNKTDSVKIEIGTEVTLTQEQLKEVIDASAEEKDAVITSKTIPALVFVRLDGVEQKENGSTHYPDSEYSKELAKGQVILLYSPAGYKVYGEIGDETVYGRILTWVEDSTESKMDEIEAAYLTNLSDREKELLNNRVELEVEQQVNERKAQIAKELLGEGYTEEEFEEIIWSVDEEEIKKAVEDILSNLDVRWYVLKDEANGTHIDGVIVTKKSDVKVVGELPAEPTPTATPTVAPTATPTAAPTATPTAAPTAAPTATPTVAPTATPTAAPTATPTAAPTATPTVAPTATPTAAPTATPTVAPTATPTAAPTATPTVAPTATPTVAPTATPTVAPTQAPVIIIDDPQVPLADGPAFTAPTVEDAPVAETEPAVANIPVAADAPVEVAPPANEGAVLGARRADEEAVVLGVSRGTEKAVLGKRRRPQTGDSMAMSVWMSVMTMSFGMAGVSGIKLSKGKRKKTKND